VATSTGESSLRGEEGILTDVNLIETMKLLMSKEMDGKFILLKSIALIPLSRPGCTKKSRPLSGDQ
jgi:hypothetical protein